MKIKKLLPILVIAPILASTLLAASCTHNAGNGSRPGRDTLHAVTLYGPTSFFHYRGQTMGADYENLVRFASDHDMELDLKIAPSLPAMLDSLAYGAAQLAAFPIPKISEFTSRVKHSGPREVTWQVLVQKDGKDKINDVTQLVGKKVTVLDYSKYLYRMQNLNEELGGGIEIVALDRDSLIADDLITMVANGDIDFTVADSDVAAVNRLHHPDLDFSVKVSLEQYSSWAVAADCDSLAARLDRWERKKETSEVQKNIYKKYFELSKNPLSGSFATALSWKPRANGILSPFDSYFRKHAPAAGIDWKMLAAICFNESGFDNSVVSWAGATGIMQMMPATAAAMGVGPDELDIPERNIYAAAKLLAHLDKTLAQKVSDKEERVKFVIAAYNSGLGHITDAIALASNHNLDPQKWLGNVSEALLLKSRPQHYNEPGVRNGYFNGRETVDFVDKVLSTYELMTLSGKKNKK